MFDEILGDEGLAYVTQATAGDLCISFFMQHRDNDIFGEMGDAPNKVSQTIIWDAEKQIFLGPNCEGWVEPPAALCTETIMANKEFCQEDSRQVPVTVEDGAPMLFTIYRGSEIQSFKFITPADEAIRRVRSRSHNRFVALFVTESLFASTQKAQYLEDAQIAKERLFTPDELSGYEVNLMVGKHSFFEDLSMETFELFPSLCSTESALRIASIPFRRSPATCRTNLKLDVSNSSTWRGPSCASARLGKTSAPSKHSGRLM